MKRITGIVILLFFSMTIYSQQIDFGKYRLCYNMYWRCHFQNLIELKSDSTYKFTYLDDTQMKSSFGKWKIDSNFVVLTPNFIPDTIQITDVFETKNKTSVNNGISIYEGFKMIPGLKVNIFQQATKKTLVTDSVGEIQYPGQVADSIVFSIKGRDLKVIPTKKVIPSTIRITIDSDYKDLVYQQLGVNKIRIQNGRMVVKYRDEEHQKTITEYFEKIN